MVPKQHRAAYKETVRRAYAAAEELKQRWVATSSYRSTKKQAELYALYLAGKGNLAARPGTSRHEYGLALDLHIKTKRGLVPVGISEKRRRVLEKHGLRMLPSEAWHFER